uniref:Uncharacterized protein LOC113786701 n=1 Tax=Cicer arietinum TaxID=3827 RepID=A0A3Q7YBG6_CICAR|nr:uncharacterized protein LOC113786701 [Cicer arietinum]
MKDLETLLCFLGIEVAYSLKGSLVSQSKYITNILEQSRLYDNRATYTSLELNVKYAPSNDVLLPYPTLYHTLVENLVYLTIIRPDIIYVVHVVSQFVVSLTTSHWIIVLRIIR